MEDELDRKTVRNQPSTMLIDFASLDNPAISEMGSNKPLEMEYATSCADYSGRPFRHDNTLELIGIPHCSSSDIEDFRKNGYYGQGSKWTRASTFKDWFKIALR